MLSVEVLFLSSPPGGITGIMSSPSLIFSVSKHIPESGASKFSINSILPIYISKS